MNSALTQRALTDCVSVFTTGVIKDNFPEASAAQAALVPEPASSSL